MIIILVKKLILSPLSSLLPPHAAQSYFSLLFSFLLLHSSNCQAYFSLLFYFLLLHSSNCQAVPGFNSLTLFFSFDGLSSKEERALTRGETRSWEWRGAERVEPVEELDYAMELLFSFTADSLSLPTSI
jgi:hypothetical protein